MADPVERPDPPAFLLERHVVLRLRAAGRTMTELRTALDAIGDDLDRFSEAGTMCDLGAVCDLDGLSYAYSVGSVAEQAPEGVA